MQPNWLSKNLILITGKGGVGKTTVAEATARHLASTGKRTLLLHALQINDEEQKVEEVAPNLWQITLRASDCFREYIILKLKVRALYTAFLGNKITQYLERAAPGIREIVLLGKIWHERGNYDHVVVDMPSTGYALTMVHTPFNFASLFPGGPVYRDSQDMIATFSDPKLAAFVTVTLPEEMPIQESVELATELKRLMPSNPSHLVLNRLTRVSERAKALLKDQGANLTEAQRKSPLWRALEYRVERARAQEDLIEGLRESWKPFSNDWIEIDEVVEKEETRRKLAIAGMISPNPPSARASEATHV